MMQARPAPREPRFDGTCFALVAAALAGALLVVWATSPWGAGIDNDVVDFFSAAESLLDGRGWVQSNGDPFALWPPLMPMLLAGARALGIPFETTLRLLHPAAMFATIWLSADLLRRITRAPLIAVACALAMAVAPVLHESMVMGLSEALFVAFAVAAVWSLQRHLETRTRASFAGCIAFTALTFLQRYLGVTLVMALAGVLLAAPAGDGWARRARRTLVFGALSTAPMVAWCLRTLALTGHLTGDRGTIPGPSLALIAEMTWTTVVAWLWPGDGRSPGVQLLTATLVLVGGAALLNPRRRPQGLAPRRLAPLAAFPLVYLGVSSYLNHRLAIDGIGDRQLVPLAPFAWIFAALAVAAARQRCARPLARRAFDGLCALAFAAHLAMATSALWSRIEVWRSEGPGVYGTRAFRESEFAALLRRTELTGRIQSNDPHAVYLLTRNYARQAPLRPGGYRRIAAGTSGRRLAPTLVWFEANARAVAPLEELGAAYSIEVVAQAPGGAIYRLEPR